MPAILSALTPHNLLCAAIGAAAGALYACASLFLPLPSDLARTLLHLGAGLLIQLSVFWETPPALTDALRCCLLHLAVSTLTGGFVTAVGNLLGKIDLPLPQDRS